MRRGRFLEERLLLGILHQRFSGKMSRKSFGVFLVSNYRKMVFECYRCGIFRVGVHMVIQVFIKRREF